MPTATPAAPAAGCLKVLLYPLLAALGVALLAVSYFAANYVAFNGVVMIDNSWLSNLVAAPWPSYAGLGLALGAAAGATAAHRRYRLGGAVRAGAVALVGAGAASLALGNVARIVPLDLPPPIAETYVRAPGQGQCPACATATATTTKASPTGRYTAAKLLDKNAATAWIADSATLAPAIGLTLVIPPGQRLVGLRLANGYGKTPETYVSFARVRTCRVALDVGGSGGPPTTFTLPDQAAPDRFIPIEAAAGTATAHVRLEILATYPGTNHPEAALSALVPVIESVEK